MKPVIAILIEYGFHEVKKYIHSGFYQKLSKDFDIVWFIVDKQNSMLNQYFETTGFPIIFLEFKNKDKKHFFFERLYYVIYKAWMRNQGIRLHHYYRQQRGIKLRDKIFGITLFKKIIEKYIFRFLRKFYFSKRLKEEFYKNNVKSIFLTSNRSIYAKEFIYTAQSLELKSWFLVNSWKDLYLGNFLPNKLTGVFVWSDSMKKEYLRHMPYLKEDSIYISGNPSFDYMLFSEITYSREYYAKKYNISLDADWIYYTMLPPGNMNDEIEIVKLIANKMLKRYTVQEKVILLRRNPNHDKNDFIDLDLPENIVLTEHYCIYNKEIDMILQSPEGEVEWFDLVNYSCLNISIPSTVTLEFLLRGKAILNIGFGSNGKTDSRLDQYIYSEFYKPLFNRKDVLLNYSVDELIINIDKIKNIKKEDDFKSQLNKGFSLSIVEVLKKNLLEA